MENISTFSRTNDEAIRLEVELNYQSLTKCKLIRKEIFFKMFVKWKSFVEANDYKVHFR